jgi:hypothetical protein
VGTRLQYCVCRHVRSLPWTGCARLVRPMSDGQQVHALERPQRRKQRQSIANGCCHLHRQGLRSISWHGCTDRSKERGTFSCQGYAYINRSSFSDDPACLQRIPWARCAANESRLDSVAEVISQRGGEFAPFSRLTGDKPQEKSGRRVACLCIAHRAGRRHPLQLTSFRRDVGMTTRLRAP